MKYVIYMTSSPGSKQLFYNLFDLAKFLGVNPKTASSYAKKGGFRNWKICKYKNCDFEAQLGGKDIDDQAGLGYGDDDDFDDILLRLDRKRLSRKRPDAPKDYRRVLDSFNTLVYHVSKFIPKPQMKIFIKLSIGEKLNETEKDMMRTLENQLSGPYRKPSVKGMVKTYNRQYRY